jgi:hypothetical protein
MYLQAFCFLQLQVIISAKSAVIKEDKKDGQ